ncbi:MAG: NFACT family protein [Nitrospirota bacterium]|nr:NFACT family protein [Nitrospirota bacterium]
MGVTTQELASVVEEIAPALAGGWIQKVYQPGPRTITLEIRAPGQTLLLLCSAASRRTRQARRLFASSCGRTSTAPTLTDSNRCPATGSCASD